MEANGRKELTTESQTLPVTLVTSPLVVNTPPEEKVLPGATAPLDASLPWVIVFRAVGTASLMQTRLSEAMVVGRGDSVSSFTPEIDLAPFDALGKGVSRKHALITIKNQRLMLRDLN